jgi:hypothetical protein
MNKKEIRTFYAGIIERFGQSYDWVNLADMIHDQEGRMFLCSGCSEILNKSALRQYEYFNEKGKSHCCRNLSDSQEPPSYVSTSWKKLEESMTIVGLWADAMLKAEA